MRLLKKTVTRKALTTQPRVREAADAADDAVAQPQMTSPHDALAWGVMYGTSGGLRIAICRWASFCISFGRELESQGNEQGEPQHTRSL
jgi:hypothetical protein